MKQKILFAQQQILTKKKSLSRNDLNLRQYINKFPTRIQQ